MLHPSGSFAFEQPERSSPASSDGVNPATKRVRSEVKNGAVSTRRSKMAGLGVEADTSDKENAKSSVVIT